MRHKPKTTEIFFAEFTNTWQVKDCLDFLREEGNLTRLRQYCLDSMVGDFADCQNEIDVRKTANPSGLAGLNPENKEKPA